MSFVKLDCGILNSTLWTAREPRDVFITALLMAMPVEFKEPLEQIEVRSLKPTGWVAPAGWYGFIAAAGIGIVNRALVPVQEGMDALERLGSPEPESRSQDHDGRRLIRIDGGYVVLNFMKYRDRDYTGAERARNYRLRQKSITAASRDVSESNRPSQESVTSTRDVTQSECRGQSAEVRVHTEEPKSKHTPPAEATAQAPATTPAEAVKPKRQKQPACAIQCPAGVDAQTWADWLALRKAKRAPVTQTVLDGANGEAQKAGMTLEEFLRVWCRRGSQGLEAAWLRPEERAVGRPSQAVDVAARNAEAKRLLFGDDREVIDV
jgi:hypothetical protein